MLLASETQERALEVPLGTILESNCCLLRSIIKYVGVYKITLAYNRRLCRAALRRVTKGTPRDKGKGRAATCPALAVSTVCDTFVTQCSWHRRKRLASGIVPPTEPLNYESATARRDGAGTVAPPCEEVSKIVMSSSLSQTILGKVYYR